MDTKQRWIGILALAGVVAFLAARAPSNDDATKIVKTTPRTVRVASNTESVQINLEKLKPRQFRDKAKEDIFKSKSWYVPPPPPKPVKLPPPPPPPPPLPPSAPPLPYSFMGSYEEPGGKLIIYLTKAGKIYSVSQGDTLDGIYRVEGINSGNFSITYLPLNIKQTLRIR